MTDEPVKFQPLAEFVPEFNSVIDPVKEKFLKLGFQCREYPPEGVQLRKCLLWRRIHDVVPTCQTNDKLWIYACMYVFAKDKTSRTHVTCEYEIVGETLSSDWVELKLYGVPVSDFLSKLDDAEHRLIEGWKAMNAT